MKAPSTEPTRNLFILRRSATRSSPLPVNVATWAPKALRRFQPQPRYDSQEAFFADSAAEWTDNPGNELRRKYVDGEEGELIAATDPEAGGPKLTLDFLGHAEYADGTKADDEDLISSPVGDYRRRYVELRQKPGSATRVRRAKEASDGRLWLQYWLYYFYNDYSLAGGAGHHEGTGDGAARIDREEDHTIWRSTPSTSTRQGELGRGREGPRSPDTPLVYVGRGSHASYFPAGYHENEAGTTSPTASARRRNAGRDHRRPGARLVRARPLG